MALDTSLDDVLDQIEMEEYLSHEGVDFRLTTGTKGTQLNVRECPRCHGTDWKVFINADTGLGNCFHGACVGEPGYNRFSFIRALHEFNGKQTADHLREYVGELGWRPKRKRERSVQKANDSAVKLPKSEPITRANPLPYLTDRGFDGALCEKYGLRISHNGTFAYTDHEGNDKLQYYIQRVVIPVNNIDGELVTFQGRDILNTSPRKYLFPPGLPGTGRYLYNADKVKGCKHIVLAEGVFDVMAAAAALGDMDGVGVVGTFGKSLSGTQENAQEDQIAQLLKLKAAGAESITFMWDGENKTIADACDASLKARVTGLPIRLAKLPPGKDPNEVSPAVVRQAYVSAQLMTTALINKTKMVMRLGMR